MTQSTSWLRTLILGGGALAGAGLLLYFLFKEDEKDIKHVQKESNYFSEPARNEKKFDLSTVSEKNVLSLLQDILESQEQMKQLIKKLTAESANNNVTFNELYLKVSEQMPLDPLERDGVSMSDFDQILTKFDDHQDIQAIVAKIMLPVPSEDLGDKLSKITCEKIVEIHKFMVDTLKSIANTFKAFPDHESYDVKVVTIVIQVISAVAVEEKFGLNMEEFEAATLAHHIELTSNEDFTLATCEMQAVMGEMVGNMPTAHT